MASLPIGTVTFLFSDIEGSTRLPYALGELDEVLPRTGPARRAVHRSSSMVNTGEARPYETAVTPVFG